MCTQSINAMIKRMNNIQINKWNNKKKGGDQSLSPWTQSRKLLYCSKLLPQLFRHWFIGNFDASSPVVTEIFRLLDFMGLERFFSF